MTIIHYIELIKPKIIFGNIISILGGFCMASKRGIDYNLLFKVTIGTLLIIASNCVLNNILDRKIDSLMTRTQNRTLVKKSVTLKHALIYAVILMFLGFSILFYTTNTLIICIATISSIIYIIIYTLLMKTTSTYSTLIGSIAGACPPVIGYCSVTNNFDINACTLITLFILWQIPHFYSISIFRMTDYTKASIPTFLSKKGIIKTKQHIICCITLFMLNLIIITLNKCTSYTFLVFMEILTSGWLYLAIKGGYNIININYILPWAKKMFITSIITIVTFNIAISIDSLFINK